MLQLETRGCFGRRTAVGACVIVLASIFASAAAAQDTDAVPRHLPDHEFIVAGYGTAGWRIVGDPGVNSFFSSVSPLLLFQFGERLLFETELEFEIEDGATRTGLEYAQIDFFVNDNLTVVAGKFLVPFGVFGERLHPTWINRFATNPPIYGHGAGILQPLLPIIADFGAMMRGSWSLGGGKSVVASAYITQGPFAEADHDEGGAMEPASAVAPRMEFVFGEETTDLSDDKMVGGRVGWVLAPSFEIDLSGMTGEFDDEASRLNAVNLSAEFRRGPTEFRGELSGLWYDVEVEEEGEGAEAGEEAHGERVVARTGGLYMQTSHRLGRWEPVLRWTRAFEVSADGLSPTPGYWQIGLGVDYWFSPAVAIMAGYEINGSNTGLPDRFVVHWSFGF